jgi:hypothetical protein
VPGRLLARALARARAARASLPRIGKLTRARQIEREEQNVRASLRYAARRLR